MLLIDGGGRITATARATVAVAHVLLMPTVASTPDALSTKRLFEEVVDAVAAMKGHISRAILLSMLKTETTFHTSGQALMKALAYPVLDTALSHRITDQEAMAPGMSVVEDEPPSPAATPPKRCRHAFGECRRGDEGGSSTCPAGRLDLHARHPPRWRRPWTAS